jgi:vacuole morphology and inheritance protein 14
MENVSCVYCFDEGLRSNFEFSDDEIQQSTALRWLAEFLSFAHEVMVPFTPRLIPAILPNLAHHVPMIQSAAIRTNKLLLNVIQKLPSPVESLPKSAVEKPILSSKITKSPTPTNSTSGSRQSTLSSQITKDGSSSESSLEGGQTTQQFQALPRTRASNGDLSLTPRAAPPAEILPPNPSSSRPHSPLSFSSQLGANGNLANSITFEELDLFDYQVTVNELTIQFLSEFEETRVAALKWLIMLHQKAPKKVLFYPCLLTGATRSNLIRF